MSLEVENNNSTATANTLVSGVATTGQASSSSDQDYYKVGVSARADGSVFAKPSIVELVNLWRIFIRYLWYPAVFLLDIFVGELLDCGAVIGICLRQGIVYDSWTDGGGGGGGGGGG